MRFAQQIGAAVLACATAMALGSCGTSHGPQESSDQSKMASKDVLAHANGNCRWFRNEVAKLGKGALSDSGSIPELITERLVKPSIPLLEDMARRQQKLAAESGDPELLLYARLFDPIIVLAQERAHTGTISERPGHAQAAILSKGFENMLTSVAIEQRDVARKAGATACSIDFKHVLISSLSG